MNKPYFTKYIPVEGEIGDGDSYIMKNAPNLRIAPGVALKHISYWDKEREKENAQKVKLFLCSRDIQVGDNVKHLNGMSEGMYKADSDLEDTCYIQTNIGGEQCTKSNWYKVIGEVSPNAIWVKEGMEFDGSECLIDIGNDTISLSDWIAYQKVNELHNPPTRSIRFKCSCCNTFK